MAQNQSSKEHIPCQLHLQLLLTPSQTIHPRNGPQLVEAQKFAGTLASQITVEAREGSTAAQELIDTSPKAKQP